jgi:hypothetical protein
LTGGVGQWARWGGSRPPSKVRLECLATHGKDGKYGLYFLVFGCKKKEKEKKEWFLRILYFELLYSWEYLFPTFFQ